MRRVATTTLVPPSSGRIRISLALVLCLFVSGSSCYTDGTQSDEEYHGLGFSAPATITSLDHSAAADLHEAVRRPPSIVVAENPPPRVGHYPVVIRQGVSPLTYYSLPGGPVPRPPHRESPIVGGAGLPSFTRPLSTALFQTKPFDRLLPLDLLAFPSVFFSYSFPIILLYGVGMVLSKALGMTLGGARVATKIASSLLAKAKRSGFVKQALKREDEIVDLLDDVYRAIQRYERVHHTAAKRSGIRTRRNPTAADHP